MITIYSGNCAILYKGEDIYTIDYNRIEGFTTTAFDEEDAKRKIRNQYNADNLADDEAWLEIVIINEEDPTSDDAVTLHEFLGWPVTGENDGDDEELESVEIE